MAKIYYNLIKAGAINSLTGQPWKVEDVPTLWRAQVEEMLAADNQQ